MEDLTGRQFGHYQIVAPLGEGGMAAVYKAYQPSMERYVAIKVLPRHMASSDEFLNRFRREAKLLAQLQHPNILPVFDYGEAEGFPYIVMPFVSSGTLAELLINQRLPLNKVLRITTQLGDALAYAHAHGMIHRDIKPSNVLIDESGNCLLTDFGLARMAESATKITSSGTVLGTPAYMSPEQGTGGEIDHRSDLYALGIILYEMVTGRIPYTAETPIAIVFKHIQDPLPSARKINPNVPESVELVLLKALAKNPNDRYQTAEDFVYAIQVAIAGESTQDIIAIPSTSEPSIPSSAGGSTTTITVEGQSAKRPMKLVIGGSIVLILIIAGVWGMSFVAKQLNPTQEAVTSTEPATQPIINPPATVTITESPTVEPSPTPAGPDAVITDPQGVTMVLVPAGEFMMGNNIEQTLAECIKLFPNDIATNCKEEYYKDETPAHKVNLDSFYIDKYEVTNLLYKVCVDAGACKAPAQTRSETHKAYYGTTLFDEYPVIWVDWNMAKTYCEWRGARLPSEAEWEKAARGESSQIYPWGNSFEGSKANFCDSNCSKSYANKGFNDSFEDVAPVTAFADGASIYGAFNLSGNVSEWVADWYSEDYYTLVGDNATDPPGPQNGKNHVIRGGSWLRYAINLRSTTRTSKLPNYTSNDIGFRCAMSIP